MADLRTDEIITLKHVRNFIQFGGAVPFNKPLYAGQDAQYISVDGVSLPELGGIDPIWVHDLAKQGLYHLVGRSYKPASLPKASLKLHERHGVIPRQLLRIGCQFNLYEPTGACADLSDFVSGWTDYVLIFSGGIVTNKDLGTRTSFNTDEPIVDSLEVEFADIYPIGSLSFSEYAQTQVDREVMDIVYQSSDNCATCDYGDQRIYAVTTSSGAGSPGLPAELIYTLNGGATWNQTSITGIGASENAIAVDIAGNYLIILGADAYYWAELASTGVPGTFTKVTTGFVATKTPQDLFVLGPREIIFCGSGGYIYKCSDVPSGVTTISAADATTQDLKRIHGQSDTLFSVGANGAIVKSTNRGKSWSTTTTSPVSTLTVQAVAVIDAKRIWVGTAFPARTYYTSDGGDTWTEVSGPWSGDGNIFDIVFPTTDVGYISHQTSAVRGKLYSTWDGGSDWSRGNYRITNFPTFSKSGRVAYPGNNDAGWRSNSIAIAGLGGNAVDGIILVGVAARA